MKAFMPADISLSTMGENERDNRVAMIKARDSINPFILGNIF